VLELKRSHACYDFGVKANEIGGEARFAGRVEIGRASFTDPSWAALKLRKEKDAAGFNASLSRRTLVLLGQKL
jgi:hypothetical protein